MADSFFKYFSTRPQSLLFRFTIIVLICCQIRCTFESEQSKTNSGESVKCKGDSECSTSTSRVGGSRNTTKWATHRRAYIELKRDLLGRDVVRDRIPPYESNTPNTTLDVYMQPYQIIEVNDDQQVIMLKMTFGIEWNDSELTWDPAQFDGIETFKLPSWIPFILIPEAIKNDHIKMPELVWVGHTGSVGVTDSFMIHLLCYLDMELFPFDNHICNFSFIIEPPFNPRYIKESEMNSYHTMGEWEIINHDCFTPENAIYGSNQIQCQLNIGRQSTFYIANVLVPMTFTSMVTLVVFIIPVGTGEKTGILLKIYISTSVYLNFIVDFLPKSMTKIPRINLLLLSQVVMIIMATLATILVTARYKQFLSRLKSQPDGDEEVLVRREEYLTKPNCCNCRLFNIIAKLCSRSQKLNHSELDYLFFYLFTLVTVLIYIAFLYP